MKLRRQAVVIIHGMGEHRPMQTLRAFVAGVFGVREPALAEHIFSKPDRISDTLELRRLNVLPRSYDGRFELKRETDFYEFYWQHLMQGTRWRPVLQWLLYFLFRPWKLNTRLHRIWIWAIIALIAVAPFVTTVVQWVASQAPELWTSNLIIVLGSLGLVLLWIAVGQVTRFFLGSLGDAVRYLNPDPPNVEARRAIRTAGLTLLRGLHEDPLRRYKRIILVGHSLGSVIAYDIITWFWQEQHHLVELGRASGERNILATHPIEPAHPPDEDKSPLKGLRDESIDLETLRDRQLALWQEYRGKGLPWLITDLITLGSPLAHADVLLADGRENLCIGKKQREFPTCPPAEEDERDCGLLWRTYDDAGRRREVRILHHGAPFAVTRWTNLFFPADVIGGPVSDVLGKGIKDVRLCPSRLGIAHTWLSHFHYWNIKQTLACEKLRAALCLNEAE
jgi:hypothetical protein